jgi:hypothetical protein
MARVDHRLLDPASLPPKEQPPDCEVGFVVAVPVLVASWVGAGGLTTGREVPPDEPVSTLVAVSVPVWPLPVVVPPIPIVPVSGVPPTADPEFEVN